MSDTLREKLRQDVRDIATSLIAIENVDCYTDGLLNTVCEHLAQSEKVREILAREADVASPESLAEAIAQALRE
jgi:hypothetical protein